MSDVSAIMETLKQITSAIENNNEVLDKRLGALETLTEQTEVEVSAPPLAPPPPQPDLSRVIAPIREKGLKDRSQLTEQEVELRIRPLTPPPAIGDKIIVAERKEKQLTKTFGKVASATALLEFVDHYKLCVDMNRVRGVPGWESSNYRAKELRYQLTGEAARFIRQEEVLNKAWVNDDRKIIEKLQEKYRDCIQMEIVEFEEKRASEIESLGQFVQRLKGAAESVITTREASRQIQFIMLIVFFSITLGVGGLIGLITKAEMGYDSVWYMSLRKPKWHPPIYIFAPTWTTVFSLMAVAAWLVWKKGGFINQALPLTCYIVQLFGGLLYMSIFARSHQLLAAFIFVVLLWCLILITTILFGRQRSLAAILMLPYLTWALFCAAFNGAYCLMNLSSRNGTIINDSGENNVLAFN